MRSKWPITLFAAIPAIAVTLALQSCAGVGGPAVDSGGLPSVTQAFLALLGPDQRSASYVGNDACSNTACHGGVADPVKDHFMLTKHADKGVSCERCHGPGGAHAAAPTKDNILTLPKAGSPVVCAQCHGPVHDQYNFSAHKSFVASPVQSASTSAASTKSSRCLACHSGLFRATVYDRGKDIADFTDAELMQIAKDTVSSAPHSANCITCHDPHSQTGNVDSNGEEKQLRHKIFNTSTTDIAPGATPDKTTKYDHACAQCHNGRGTNPADTALNSGTSRPSMHDSNQMNMLMGFGGVEGTGPVLRNTAHAEAPGQCVKCHMPDSRHTFTVSYDKGCAPCHTAADAAARVNSTKSEMLDGLLALKNRLEAWATTTYSNSLFWDYSSLVQAEGFTPPNQAGIPIQIKRARHNYYFIVRSGDYGVHNAPYAKHLLNVANQNLDALSVPSALPSRSKMSKEEKLASIQQDLDRARRAEINELEAEK